MIKWHLEQRKLSSLKPYHKNPRYIKEKDAEHLKTSIEKFGLIDKPIINPDGTIIGGHQRINVLDKTNTTSIDCWIPDKPLDEKQIEELNIRLNKNSGDWDWDVLANEWNSEDLLNWGFTEEELIGESIEDLGSTLEQEDELLTPPKNPITKLGDVYQLNQHRLICGDSTMPDIVAKCLDGNEPILMVTDPPYGVNYDPDWRGKAGKGQKASGKVKNDDQINWALAWNLFAGSVAYIWHAAWFTSQIHKSLEDADYKIINQIIWKKQNFALSRGDYHWQHEPCWYAVKNGHQHNWQGSRKESTIWEISNLNAFGTSKDEDVRTAHSTQKPLECMSIPIKNNSAEGEGVYDPFMGSGTTLIAAQTLKRICYGIELDPAYCDIIVKRWINHMKKQNAHFEVKKNNEICEEFN